MNYHPKLVVSLVSMFLVLIISPVRAAEAEQVKSVYLDEATVSRGYTVRSVDENLAIGFLPGVLQSGSLVTIDKGDPGDFIFPQGLLAVSEVYSISIDTASPVETERPYALKIKTANKSANLYYLTDNEWQPLKNKLLKSEILAESAELNLKIVLLESDIMKLGHASWYKYKGCDCAASPDYPKGTRLLVKNLDNGKEVIVTVNDFGPNRKLFPQRVIDLDKVAFRKLAPLSKGVLKNIEVTKIK